jgi:hypothetical protein
MELFAARYSLFVARTQPFHGWQQKLADKSARISAGWVGNSWQRTANDE